MFRNYFNLTIRLILRNKIYSFINIFGFAMGLAVFILILLFIRHEYGYDRFYQDNDRIYRVTRAWYNDDGEESLHLARVAPPIGPMLADDFPDLLEEVVRALSWDPQLKIGEKKFASEGLFFVEENFFRVFSTEMIEGEPESALSKPNTILLSEKMARRFFGEEDPVGKVIDVVGAGPFTVDGVFRDLPENTHFKYEILVSFITLENFFGADELMNNWGSNNYVTYLKFAENTHYGRLEEQLNDFIDRHYTPVVSSYLGKEPDRPVSEGTKLHLQKLTDIHLRSHLSTELEPNGDIRTVRIFSTIAFFILLIASINFINLSTARSANRASEVAIRKVAGASRGKLIAQFLIESLLLTIVSLILAIVTADLVLPEFSNYISRELSFTRGSEIETIVVLSLIGLLTGFLSGLYPAFYLSRFRPIRILRSAFSPGKSSTPMRTILVVTQFAISIALVISIGVINRQMKYIQTVDTGFNRQDILRAYASERILDHIEDFKERLLEDPKVLGVSSSRLIPSNDLINSSGGRTVDGDNPGPIPFRLAVVGMDYDFFENLGIKLLAGRNFSREFSTDDSIAFILNAEAVRQLGWGDPENAIDRPFTYSSITGKIIGVVDDIKFETLHNPVVPIIYRIRPSGNYQVCIRISGEDRTSTIKFIENVYLEFDPDGLFDYRFLDDIYNDNYRTEFQMGRIMVLFSLFAIIIACLGLFGLSSFLSELKSNEVGIRKVLGASIPNVVLKLGLEFTRWVLVANLLAWPAAWFLMKRWLDKFAFHIEIPWIIFLLATVVSMGIALATVSFQAIRSALRNPVDSIRYE